MDTTETREFVIYSEVYAKSKTMDDEINCVNYPLEEIKGFPMGRYLCLHSYSDCVLHLCFEPHSVHYYNI